MFERVAYLSLFGQQDFVVRIGPVVLGEFVGLNWYIETHLSFICIQKVIALVFLVNELAWILNSAYDVGNLLLKSIQFGHFNVFELCIYYFLGLFGINFYQSVDFVNLDFCLHVTGQFCILFILVRAE